MMQTARKTPIPKAVLQETPLEGAQQRAAQFMGRLETHYPKDPKPPIDFANPYECVIAAILSEGVMDKVTNQTTPALFAKYPTVASLADADPTEVEAIIHPLRWYHNKARYIIETAQVMRAHYGGQPPTAFADLMNLPGVSNKTANLIADAIGTPQGIEVDTHVFLISHRLGFSNAKTPEKTGKDLAALFPADQWRAVTFDMIAFGKDLCQMRYPQCTTCFMNDVCPYWLGLQKSQG